MLLLLELLLYRTGKSFLMNRLAGSNTGFDLGSTIESKTKGIWIWCVQHPQQHDLCLVLLDTEGLGDVEKGDSNHDALIFVTATLLSSTLIYNSIGTIDQKAIENIHFITEISEHVKLRSGSSEDGDETTNFDRFFPDFIWVVRDFSLQLKKQEKDITEDEYLEHALQLKHGSSRKVNDYNLPRECITRYFRTKKCFVFPRPVEKAELLPHLEKIPTSQLDAAFVQKADSFVSYVYNHSKVKSVEGRKLNGSMLAEIANCYVQSINNGVVPCIQSAVETMSQIQNAKAVEEAIELYKTFFENAVQLPTETMEELSVVHPTCEEEACRCFLQQSIFDNDRKYYYKMVEQLKNCYEEFCQENKDLSNSICTTLLESLHSPIIEGSEEGKYAVPGGYELYRNDVERMKENYNATPGKGVMAGEALFAFLKKIEITGNSILKADKKLSEQEKRVEAERLKTEMTEKQLQAEKKEKAMLENMQADMQRSHQEHIQRLQCQIENDKITLQREFEATLEKKTNEQQELIQRGFQEKADLMNNEISGLKNELAAAKNDSGGGFFTFIGKAIDKVGSCIPIIGGIFGRK